MLNRILSILRFVPAWFATVLFIAAMLFCVKRKKRSYFWLRFIPCAIVYNILPFLIPNSYTNNYLTLGWFSFSYLIFALLTAGIIYLCFEVKPINVVFYVSAAYAMQNCAFQLYSLIVSISWQAFNFVPNYTSIIIGLVSYGAVYNGAYFLLVRRIDEVFYERMYLRITIVSAITVGIVYVLDMWLRSEGYMNRGVYIYSLLVDLLLIIAQAGIFRESRFEREQIILTELLRQEIKQHSLSEQNVNILNIKFHDLKHMIEEVRDGNSENVSEIERAVEIYDSFVKSGNEVLDIVLTEKSLICKTNAIKLGIIADGAALSFVSGSDISILFGNILDNAIEALQNVEEDDRIISLNVYKQKGFVYIHQDNRCINKLEFENGLPKTIKNDTDFHGFGTKSIKLIAEKYGGTVSMHCEDEVFGLEIIIPIPS